LPEHNRHLRDQEDNNMMKMTLTSPAVDESLRRLRPRKTGLVVTALVAVALLAAACSSGSPSASVAHTGSTTTTAPSSSGKGSNTGLTIAYSQCMRSHGVPDFPDPNSQGAITGSGSSASGINPQSPQFQAAQKSCAKLAPSGGTPAQQAQNLAQAVKYAACMRSHGVANFPDPNSSNGGIGFESTGIDRNSPQYLAASKTCQPLLPGGAGKGGGS
jgi:hypothetical protein